MRKASPQEERAMDLDAIANTVTANIGVLNSNLR